MINDEYTRMSSAHSAAMEAPQQRQFEVGAAEVSAHDAFIANAPSTTSHNECHCGRLWNSTRFNHKHISFLHVQSRDTFLQMQCSGNLLSIISYLKNVHIMSKWIWRGERKQFAFADRSRSPCQTAPRADDAHC